MNSYTNTLESSMSSYSNYAAAGAEAGSFTDQISQILLNSGIKEEIVSAVVSVVNTIYGIIDLSAIQILILLVAMQSISPSLYEAATVEGATAWESFWKITFPMISPMIFTCFIYTVIDSFTDSSNKVMSLISETAFTNLNFSVASAMGWIYFAVITVILVVFALLFRSVLLASASSSVRFRFGSPYAFHHS